MSADTVKELREDYDHRSHQEMMFDRLVKSQEDMFSRLEMMLSKLLGSQQQTLVSQQETLSKLLSSQQETFEFLRSNITVKNHDKDKEDVPSSDTDNSDSDTSTEIKEEDGVEEEEVPLGGEENDQQSVYGGQEKSTEIVVRGSKRLFEAAGSGEWNDAREFFKRKPEEIRMIDNNEWKLALLIAVHKNQLLSVEEILRLMPPEALQYETKETLGLDRTALHEAAMYGYTEAAKVLVNKIPVLTQIRDRKGRVPLQLAVESFTIGQAETVKYLYSVTQDVKPSPFLGHEGASILSGAISANFYDVALSLVKRFRLLVTQKQQADDICGLEAITQRRLAFRSGYKLTWWKQYIYSSIDVDRDFSYNQNAILADEQKNSTTGTTNILQKDEENALGSSECTQITGANTSKRVSSASDKGIMSMFVSVFTQVLPIRQYLFKKKLMHKQAVALVSEMLILVERQFWSEYVIVQFFDGNPNIMKTAIKHGSVEVVAECLRKFPFLVQHELGGQTMMQMAIMERNEKIFDLICETSGNGKMDLINKIDDDGNTLLHYVAHLASPYQLSSITGAILQMQRELQWFKGVQSMVAEKDKVFKKNKKGDIAEHVFTTEHKDLVEKGEKYMKDTSGSCMVVAALIATVAFAAAFTVPGGNISDSSSGKNGTPIFLESTSFVVFAAADALSLFSSITSVLMFLAIYTSRYAEQDFLMSLPRKMIIGLATLFVSMAAILIAFGASLCIVLVERFPWAPIPIALLSCIPPISFAFLQLPLFIDMVRSTFWSRPFQKHNTNMIEKKKED